MTITIAVVGDVDASKSTLIGVLSKNIMDDGRGKARSKILTLKHEKETGRTSNVMTFMVSLPSSLSSNVNNNENNNKNNNNNTNVNNNTNENENKDIRFIDLAGHEPYISTTLRGITAYSPDYALLLIEGPKGCISKMTREYINILVSLQIPFFIGITKIDITPPKQLAEIKKMIKVLSKNINSFHYEIKNENTLERAIKAYDISPWNVCPYFQISNITGLGLDNLKKFIYNLNKLDDKDENINNYIKDNNINKLFLIHKPYHIKGIGYVVYGVSKGNTIEKNDILKIGPINNQYIPVRVRSIHDQSRTLTNKLDGIGCLAIKPISNFKLTKKMIKNGKVCIDKNDKTIFVSKIEAEIKLFNKSITITNKHTPYIHSSIISINTKVEKMNNLNGDNLDIIRSCEHAFITLSFKTKQFIYPGERLLIRDGRIIGHGIIKNVY